MNFKGNKNKHQGTKKNCGTNFLKLEEQISLNKETKRYMFGYKNEFQREQKINIKK
jgi:hypothetical protein